MFGICNSFHRSQITERLRLQSLFAVNHCLTNTCKTSSYACKARAHYQRFAFSLIPLVCSVFRKIFCCPGALRDFEGSKSTKKTFPHKNSQEVFLPAGSGASSHPPLFFSFELSNTQHCPDTFRVVDTNSFSSTASIFPQVLVISDKVHSNEEDNQTCPEWGLSQNNMTYRQESAKLLYLALTLWTFYTAITLGGSFILHVIDISVSTAGCNTTVLVPSSAKALSIPIFSPWHELAMKLLFGWSP